MLRVIRLKKSSFHRKTKNAGENKGPLVERTMLRWTEDLHNKFLHAINQLGINKCSQASILKIMNAPGITRKNVSSHLQKYRADQRKLAASGIFQDLQESGGTSGNLSMTGTHHAVQHAPVRGPSSIPLENGLGYSVPLNKYQNNMCIFDNQVTGVPTNSTGGLIFQKPVLTENNPYLINQSSLPMTSFRSGSIPNIFDQTSYLMPNFQAGSNPAYMYQPSDIETSHEIWNTSVPSGQHSNYDGINPFSDFGVPPTSSNDISFHPSAYTLDDVEKALSKFKAMI